MDSPQGEIMAENNTNKKIKIKIQNPLLGVPITFLDKYNPEQFEIVGNSDSNVLPDGWRGASKQIVDDYYLQGNKVPIREGWRNPIFYTSNRTVIAPFKRILIRQRLQ